MVLCPKRMSKNSARPLFNPFSITNPNLFPVPLSIHPTNLFHLPLNLPVASQPNSQHFFCKKAEYLHLPMLASNVGFQILDYFKKQNVYTHSVYKMCIHIFSLEKEKRNDQLLNVAHSCYSNSSTACNTSDCSRL